MLGIQSGINVVGAMIYPTSLRANGSGWQLGIGRLGAIVGPFLGALFVGLPVEQLYTWSALPFAVGAVVAFIIYRAQRGAAAGASGTGQGAVEPHPSFRTGASALRNDGSKRLVSAQRRDHLSPNRRIERISRASGRSAKLNSPMNTLNTPACGGGADLCRDRLRRADKDEIVLEQIIGIEQMLHDLRGAGLAAADEHLGVFARTLLEGLAGLRRA